jgi:hypothetical protein
MEKSDKDYKPYTVKWIADDGQIENWLVDGTNWDMMMEMADDKANGRSIEVWTRHREDKEDELLYSKLSSVRQKELDEMLSDMTDEAKSMVQDFVDNPSELSGEVDFKNKKAYGDIIRIHQNSPQLDEDESSWKSMEELENESKESKDK